MSEHIVRCHFHHESTLLPLRTGILYLVLDIDLDPSHLSDLLNLRRLKPGPVPWDELDVDPTDFPLPRPPKPGPPSWEGLLDRQLRVRRMAFLLIQGYSLRAIAKDLGIACTTVDRMKPDMAQFNLLARTLPSPPPEREPEDPAARAHRVAIRTGGLLVHEHRPREHQRLHGKVVYDFQPVGHQAADPPSGLRRRQPVTGSVDTDEDAPGARTRPNRG